MNFAEELSHVLPTVCEATGHTLAVLDADKILGYFRTLGRAFGVVNNPSFKDADGQAYVSDDAAVESWVGRWGGDPECAFVARVEGARPIAVVALKRDDIQTVRWQMTIGGWTGVPLIRRALWDIGVRRIWTWMDEETSTHARRLKDKGWQFEYRVGAAGRYRATLDMGNDRP